MRRILCFGDSNTYGFDPVTQGRLAEDIRWPGRLAKLLGDDWRVIEEGCNGRTTRMIDPSDPWKSGLEYLKPCIHSHKPLDLIIVMLGTNDLKTVFGLSTEEIAGNAEALVHEIDDYYQKKTADKVRPPILLISPPEIGPGIATTSFLAPLYDETAITRSKEFSGYYRTVAERNGCWFLDSAPYMLPSEQDSLHVMPEGHAKMAEAVYTCVKEIFAEG